MQAGVINRSLIGSHRAQQLVDHGALVTQLLAGNGVLLPQGFIQGQVRSCVFQRGAALLQLPLGLLQLRLVGQRVHLGQQVALLHRAALFKHHPLEHTVDAALHDHGIERCHRTNGLDLHIQLTALGRLHAYHRRRAKGHAMGHGCRRSRTGKLVPGKNQGSNDGGKQQ